MKANARNGRVVCIVMLLISAASSLSGQPTRDQLLARVMGLPERYRKVQLEEPEHDLTTIGMTERTRALTDALVGDAALLGAAFDGISVRQALVEINRDLDGIVRYVDVKRNWRYDGGSITGNLCVGSALVHVERLIGWYVRMLYRDDDRLDVEAWLASWAEVCDLDGE